MSACAKCLQQCCCCESEPKDLELIKGECSFNAGIYNNVDIEIGENCQILSLTQADKEQVNLCDPCDDHTEYEPTGDLYQQGYDDARDRFYEQGKLDGAESAYEEGRNAGYQTGFAAGEVTGYQKGQDDCQVEDCSDERQAGYDEGYDAGYNKAKSEAVGIGAVLSEVDNAVGTTIRVSWNDTNGDEQTAFVTQSDGQWSSNNEDVAVDEDGLITIENGIIPPASGISIIINPTQE